jgi:hypothetical protein
MISNLEARLDVVRESQTFPPVLLDRLAKWIETAEERHLYRINPLKWAAANQVDEEVAINLFLHATNAGIFDLVWAVLCTQCSLQITTPGGLRAFSKVKRHCRL